MTTGGKNEGRRRHRRRLVNGEKPPRRPTTGCCAMHPTIVINGGNITTANPPPLAGEATGAIEATVPRCPAQIAAKHVPLDPISRGTLRLAWNSPTPFRQIGIKFNCERVLG